MAAPSAGSVVLVRFPFSDLSESKLRPAVVLAVVGRGDSILCQITSNTYADDRSIQITDESFAAGGLQRVSYARPGKLFTAHRDLVAREVGRLTPEAQSAVVRAVVGLLEAGL